MKKLAIIGSGISALGALYELKDDFKITLFEKENYLGGHTNTVEIQEPTGVCSIDTGFIVYNTTTYPFLTSLFEKLKVETEWSDMSFSFQNGNYLEWAGHDLNSVFGQRKNLFRPFFWSMLYDIMRFKKEALIELNSFENNTLGKFLKKQNFEKSFVKFYILPMGSAIWSMPENEMLEFPAKTFIQFFLNHGMLGPSDHLRWRTVKGGSKNYLQAIIKAANPEIRLNSPVLTAHRNPEGVEIKTKESTEVYDKVLIATHADQALRILDNPTKEEVKLLSCFKYQKNKAILHTDISVMPTRKKCWASWNYRLSESGEKTSLGYYMNRLQNLKTNLDYVLSLNEFSEINPSKIVYEKLYEHPLFDTKSIEAQKELHKLNEDGQIFFSGSYFNYGFHEDGLASSLKAAKRIRDAN